MRQPCVIRPIRLLVVMDVIASATLAPAPAEADCCWLSRSLVIHRRLHRGVGQRWFT